jgi:hypothetical protein
MKIVEVAISMSILIWGHSPEERKLFDLPKTRKSTVDIVCGEYVITSWGSDREMTAYAKRVRKKLAKSPYACLCEVNEIPV